MSRFMKKRSSVLFVYTAFLLLLMSLAGFYSIYITNSISSDAMIINKLGIIRGSIQRAVKLELNNEKSDEVIQKVDITIAEFKDQRIRLYDKNNEVMDAINNLETSWAQVKASIYGYRDKTSEENRLQLLKVSEEAWYKANSMVFVSQNSAEEKITRYKVSFLIFFFNIGLSLLIIFLIKKYVKDSLEFMVNYDSLTQAYNRRFFTDFMHKELIRSERYNRAFSLIMFDIDFFKKVNDQYGHDTGDKLLKELSERVKQSIRKSDFFARIGGEEFAVIAPETNLEEAMHLAEKIRSQIQGDTFADKLKVTISLGVAQYKDKDDENTIYKRADEALYRAKGNGRNRTESE